MSFPETFGLWISASYFHLIHGWLDGCRGGLRFASCVSSERRGRDLEF